MQKNNQANNAISELPYYGVISHFKTPKGYFRQFLYNGVIHYQHKSKITSNYKEIKETDYLNASYDSERETIYNNLELYGKIIWKEVVF